MQIAYTKHLQRKAQVQLYTNGNVFSALSAKHPASQPSLSVIFPYSAQTSPVSTSQPRTHIIFQARALKIPAGVLILPEDFCALQLEFPPQITFVRPSPTLSYRGFCSSLSNSATMSTLSQPQTPSALNSPLREHRHRPVERLTDRLETPSLDDRKYRVVRLPNQLEVLLVHDADTDKASAAMDVNVGNFSDEEDMPGMAHAVEHLLFMGTKKVQSL